VAHLVITRHTAEQTQGIEGQLVDVYATVYDIPPYQGDPFFTPAMFASRLTAAYETPGFECVVGRLDGEVVGWVHGATLPPDRAWWLSLDDRRPAPIRAAADQGDVFWLRELMVLPKEQNRGLGRQLHDATLGGRGEAWGTLTCIIDNQPAHDAYLRWGYSIIGEIRHAPESPLYDAMVLPPR
jgi:GNAT superfamily N-acetyltransferase